MSQPSDASPNIAALTRRIRNLGRLPWVKAVSMNIISENHVADCLG